MPSKPTAGVTPPSATIPESVTAASNYGDSDVDLHLAEQLLDPSLVIEEIARELVVNALRADA